MRIRRGALGLLLLLAAAGPAAAAEAKGQMKYTRVPTQFIAALGDPGATSGSGAQEWGLWRVDPGPRGVRLERYAELKSAGGEAPAHWKFDSADWWLEEHGLIMEKPEFPLAPGSYVVTGDREMTAVLTVHAKDAKGEQRWELDRGATLHDVTHLACRSARYMPAAGGGACTPERTPRTAFPVAPGGPMPPIEGCSKQDYAVLIVVGMATEE